MFIFGWIAEFLFFGFCGWLGYVVVKLITFGKVDMDFGEGAESPVAEWIGCAFFVVGLLLFASFAR